MYLGVCTSISTGAPNAWKLRANHASREGLSSSQRRGLAVDIPDLVIPSDNMFDTPPETPADDARSDQPVTDETIELLDILAQHVYQSITSRSSSQKRSLGLLDRQSFSPEGPLRVLHDVFDVPFDQIADTLGIRTDAARALASRGRRAVRDSGVPRHNAELAEQRRVVAAFLRACQQGDLAGLLAVLAPDVTLVGDGGGLPPSVREPVSGAERVGRFLFNLGRRANDPDVVLMPVLVNGDLGLYGAGELGGNHTAVVMAFGIADGRITAVFNQLNPDKLGHLPPLEPN